MKHLWIAALCAAAAFGDQITVLFDEPAVAPLAGGWGYSALVEYHGKRILFDAGGNAGALRSNAKALGIDLGKLDAVVISHDDSDHYAGLEAVLASNPRVKVYVPESESGAFSTAVFTHVIRFIQSAIPGQHIVDPPAQANYVRVREAAVVAPGARLIVLPFASGDRREQALLLDVPRGVVLLTGCAHPGLIDFAKHASAPVRLAAGGFHLMTASEPDIRRAVQTYQSAGIESVSPGHCTGVFATRELRRVYGSHFEAAGVGGTIPLPK